MFDANFGDVDVRTYNLLSARERRRRYLYRHTTEQLLSRNPNRKNVAVGDHDVRLGLGLLYLLDCTRFKNRI